MITTPAGCTSDGVKTFTCPDCSATKTEPIAAGHKPATDWSKDATNHWHACTNTGCTEKPDNAPHSYGEDDRCVCGAVKPSTPTSDYTLAYGEKDGKPVVTVSPNLPTTGRYYVHFYDANGISESHDFNTRNNYVDISFPFAGESASTYTRAELVDDNTGAIIATLNKSLTTKYSGTPINITGITLANDPNDAEQWIATVTADATSESGVLVKTRCGGGGRSTVTVGADGKFSEYIYKSNYDAGEVVTFHFVKATGSVDDSGNATITYTPMGSGYKWIVPSESSDTPITPATPASPRNDYTLAYAMENGEVVVTVSSDLPGTTDRYPLYFYDKDGISESTHFYTFSNHTDISFSFANHHANTYTRAELVDGTGTVVATLNKSLTTKYSSTPINITGVTLTDDETNANRWIATIRTDAQPESGETYFFFYERSGGGRSGSTASIENGTIQGNIHKGDFTAGDTAKLYLMKVTGSVDADGNATLTYTPMGSGYTWTVPGAESNT